MHNVRGGNYFTPVNQAVIGRISFECSCGRYRYWFRFIASVGNSNLGRIERAFPKIRNPGLRGIACKHIIKCLTVMQMPTIKARLAQQMERQAKKAAPPSGKRKFLSDRDLKKTAQDAKVPGGDPAVKKALAAFSKQKAQEKAAKVAAVSAAIKAAQKELGLSEEEALKALADAANRKKGQTPPKKPAVKKPARKTAQGAPKVDYNVIAKEFGVTVEVAKKMHERLTGGG